MPYLRGFGWWGSLLAPFVCNILGLGVGISVLAIGLFQRKPQASSELLRQRVRGLIYSSVRLKSNDPLQEGVKMLVRTKHRPNRWNG